MKRLLFYGIVYFIFIVLFGGITLIDHLSREKDYLSAKLKEEFSFYRNSFNTFDILANFFLYKMSTDNQLKEKFQTEKDINSLSKWIFDRYKDDYMFLSKYGIKKIYIYLPDGQVVLRFHNPERILDKIDTLTNQLGIIYFSRISNNDKVLANIKLVIPFVYARNILKKTFPNKEYLFLIKNKYLSFKEFTGYIESELDKTFYYYFAENLSSKISKLNMKLSEIIKKDLFSFQSFNVSVKDNGQWYIVYFIPISKLFNNLPKDLGYLVSYEEDNYIGSIRKNFWEVFLLGNGVFGGLLLLMFYRFKDKEKYEQLASIDPLTKITNRRKFDELAQYEFDKAKRYNRPLSFIIFDIDDFKKINDKYGHQMGDKVLIEVANTVKNSIRKTDIFARFGGEEFVILAPETDIIGGKQLAEKIRKIIEEISLNPVSKITASFGVTEIKDSDNNIDDLYRRADKALYQAKEKGKNRVFVML